MAETLNCGCPANGHGHASWCTGLSSPAEPTREEGNTLLIPCEPIVEPPTDEEYNARIAQLRVDYCAAALCEPLDPMKAMAAFDAMRAIAWEYQELKQQRDTQLAAQSSEIAELRSHLASLRERVADYLAACDAVDEEAERASQPGANAWSSAPMVRMLDTRKALRDLATPTPPTAP